MTSQDVILGILMKRTQSGYDIKHLLETLFVYFFDASYGTIYPTLARMEKEGLITKESVQQDGKPNKNLYTITEQGMTAFHTFMKSGMSNDVVRSELLVRLQFGEYAEPGQLAQWLEDAYKQTEAKLAKLEKDIERYDKDLHPSQRISIEFGIEMTTFKLERLKEARLKAERWEQ